MTYKYIITPVVFALLSFAGFAQTRGYSKTDTLRDARGNVAGFSFEVQILDGVSKQDRVESIQTQKISFFSYAIGLSTQEAELFWPMYNEYMKKYENLVEKRRKAMMLITSNQLLNMDEKTIKKNLEDYLNCENEQMMLKMEYYRKFSQVLSPLKMVKYYIAEDEFQKRLIRALRSGGW